MNDERAINLVLTPGELTATIEALHDAVLRRIRWSITPEFPYRRLDITIAQDVINAMIAAYTAALMEYRTGEFAKLEAFEERFTFPKDIWDILAEFTKANKWSQVSVHPPHTSGCDLCEVLLGTP